MVALGVIRKAIGLNGLCAVEAFGETLGRLGVPKEVFIGGKETHCRRIMLEHVEFRPKGPVCFFEGVTDRNAAELLRNSYIYLADDELPRLSGDTFYHFELTGCDVQTDRGEILGRVISVHNFPTVDSIEVSMESETVIIPLTAEALVTVDKTNGSIIIRHSFIEELL
jgi:16S rRNA processing protein RimM